MLIARAIYDQSDKILINHGVKLTPEFIKKMENRGVIGAYIEDEITNKVIVQEAITNELRTRAVKSIKDFDIETTINLSKNIVEQLMASDSILLDLVDLRTFDDYTYRHSVNVAVLSTMIAMGMDFKVDELTDLCLAALLHDIGKLRIDDAILNKPTRLTEEEYALIKTHPSVAYNIVKERWDIAATTKIGILCHHENVDGSGYPFGLKDQKIHRFARIIHVADVFDALTSKRPYKDAYSPGDASEFLMSSCGTLFDREVVEIFLGYVPIYPKGSTVILSDKRRAIVAENIKFNILRPRVIIEDTGEELDLTHDPACRNITIIDVETVE
ncbi:MAG: HD-GYP domain-containing protein [Lachnospiraceae bacterium]|nr:HD-GYP domain-containing protein [Lachnospiraceae bacterium]